VTGELTLDLLDEKGNRLRHYSSSPPTPSALLGNAPEYWFAPTKTLQTSVGLHRFVWDLRAEDPQTLTYGYFGGKLDYIEYTLPNHSISGDTPRQQPQGPLVAPGRYEAVLTVGGEEYRQPVQVVLDPRVHTAQTDLVAQWNLAKQITAALATSYKGYNQYAALNSALARRQTSLQGDEPAKDLLESLIKLQKSATAIGEGSAEVPGMGPLNRDLARYLIMVESADSRPAASAENAVREACTVLQNRQQAWQELNEEEVAEANRRLEGVHLAGLPIADPDGSSAVCARWFP
jgi:hypothetical protein